MPDAKRDNPGCYVLAFVAIALLLLAGDSLWRTGREKGWIYQESLALMEYEIGPRGNTRLALNQPSRR